MDKDKPIFIVLPDKSRGSREIQAIEDLAKKIDQPIHILSDVEDIKLLDSERKIAILDEYSMFNEGTIERILKPKEGYNVVSDKSQGEFPIVYGGRPNRRRQVAIAANLFGDNSTVVSVQSEKSKEIMRSKSIGLFAAALLSSVAGSNIQADPQFAEKKDIKPKGNRFVIEGVEIYALNRKNAERKYKNMQRKA